MPLATVMSLALFVHVPAAEIQAPGFDHATCRDRFGRSIDYYLSPPVAGKSLPIALLVQGSGGQSIWPVVNGKAAGGLQNLLLARVKDHLRVLVVEKPGVSFGFMPPQPGTAEGCPEAFLKEHTLKRWVAANDAALEASLNSPGIDPSRLLAIGHSEGGIVVATLAAQNPKVTDVASLAGGGPKQSEDLRKLFGNSIVKDMLAKIQTEPESTTKFIFGHPYRRWSTFMATSTTEQALKSNARFFIAQGTEDKAVDPAGAEQLHEALRSKGREVTFVKVEGGDHGFSTDANDHTGNGFAAIFDQILTWLLKR